tara:strand:+ start:264 stop:761 length:498 start_codon:yes stop_codon:yes gene_type:complete
MKYLLFVFFFFNTISVAYANDVVYIDMNHILSNSIQGKSILSQLDIKNKSNVKELELKENILKGLEKNISNQQNILSKEELKKQINNLKSKVLVFNKDKDKLVREFNELKNKEISDFMNNVEPLILNYMKKNSINIVLDKKNVIIGKKDNDITLEILEIVNLNIK